MARDAQLPAAIALLHEGMVRIPVGRYGRATLELQAALLCAASGDTAALEAVILAQGADALSAPVRAFSEIMREQLSGDWQRAAETGETHRDAFRAHYVAGATALAWLCVGHPDRAQAILGGMTIDYHVLTSSAWLHAFVLLRLGDSAGASEVVRACPSAGVAHPEQVTEEDLLRWWDRTPELSEDNSPAYWHPILPPSLTGLDATVVRPPFGPPILPH
jgi:hypothetical protein